MEKATSGFTKLACGVCGTGVGRNSVQCTNCQKWVHKKCSGIKYIMIRVCQSFVCKGCTDQPASMDRTSMDTGDGTSMQLLDKFCYPGNMLRHVDCDADAAVEVRVRKGWNKFRQLVPLITNKDVSLLPIGKLYRSCMRSCMLHGSETWPVKKDNKLALQQAEMRMIRWTCGIKVTERFTCSKLRKTRINEINDIKMAWACSKKG